MAAGIELARWFADEAARVYGELGGCRDSSGARFDRDQRRLISWIRQQGGRVTVRDLTRGPRRFRGDRGAELAENALEILAHSGEGEWEIVDGGDQGGRPTRLFVLSAADGKTTDSHAISGDGDVTPKINGNGEVSSPSPLNDERESETMEWSA
jgi:hypothetical protein